MTAALRAVSDDRIARDTLVLAREALHAAYDGRSLPLRLFTEPTRGHR